MFLAVIHIHLFSISFLEFVQKDTQICQYMYLQNKTKQNKRMGEKKVILAELKRMVPLF